MTTETATRVLTAGIMAEDALVAIETCLVAVSKTNRTPILTGIHVRADADGITFAAADGFQLITVAVPAANPDRNEWAAVLDAGALKDSLAAIKTVIKAQRYESDRAPIVLTYNGGGDKITYGALGAEIDGRVTMLAGLSSITIPTLAGRFPDYQQLIPIRDAKDGGKVAYNAGLAAKILTVAAKHTERGIVAQRIQEPKEPMRFDWRQDTNPTTCTWRATAVLMPMFVSWESDNY